MKVNMFIAQSCPISVTPWTVACQASLSMKFFRQEYWLGRLFFLSLTVQIYNCLCVCLIL